MAEKRGSAKADDIRPHMSEDELRAAGVIIDLPYESGSSNPQPLRYGEGDEGDLEREMIERVRAARGTDGDAA